MRTRIELISVEITHWNTFTGTPYRDVVSTRRHENVCPFACKSKMPWDGENEKSAYRDLKSLLQKTPEIATNHQEWWGRQPSLKGIRCGNIWKFMSQGVFELNMSGWWLNQPIVINMLVKLDHFAMNINNIFETTTPEWFRYDSLWRTHGMKVDFKLFFICQV